MLMGVMMEVMELIYTFHHIVGRRLLLVRRSPKQQVAGQM
jgi:hypothetical protein